MSATIYEVVMYLTIAVSGWAMLGGFVMMVRPLLEAWLERRRCADDMHSSATAVQNGRFDMALPTDHQARLNRIDAMEVIGRKSDSRMSHDADDECRSLTSNESPSPSTATPHEVPNDLQSISTDSSMSTRKAPSHFTL
eukprot:gnl/MRDRNA2_/MRDRNA2_25893_c0_seq1.p1 gnl/MRDRNA2_/MRDRNA2_25893_c0~~gnl/MRDRNA2_/MRDRNA2_25893_c0_seq1.p1  ORF type:complete len:139 (+),score=21.11 gnl/MRDRNA2_/MRDRNA2_25893_c0_seq1:115-531(+)